MRKRRYAALLLAAAMLVCGLTACSRGGDAGGADTPGAWEGEDLYPDLGVYVMRIGHVQPPDNPRHISLLQFQSEVENATCGHVRVEIIGEGKLGSEKEMLERVIAGQLEGMRGGQYDFTPRLLMFTLPFLTTGRAQINALLSSDLAAKVCQEAGQATGTVLLNVCDAGGYRQLSNSVREIRTPEDVAGLKLRSNGMLTTNLTIETLGAETVTVPYQDLYTALASGVADGQDNPWINSYELKLYEAQKYFTELNYQFHPDPFYVNDEWWNTLPAQFQDILRGAAVNMGAYNDRLIDENSEAAKKAILASGTAVYIPTADELEAFRQAMAPVYDQCVARNICTADELAEMQRIVSAVG